MSFATIDHAAGLLADLRLKMGGFAVIDDLPQSCRPTSLFEGYDVQRRVRELLARRRPGHQIGWSIGCATPVMQRFLKIPHPCAGTLYENTSYRHHAVLQAERFARFGLTCEIAVQLCADLSVRPQLYSQHSVAPAIGTMMSAMGIIEHRFSDFQGAGVNSLAADDFGSGGCILGEPVQARDIEDLSSLTGTIKVDGATVGNGGYRAVAIMSPLTALAWLADHCIGLGEPLRAGQIIMLGSVVDIIYPRTGQRIEAEFNGLPAASVEVV